MQACTSRKPSGISTQVLGSHDEGRFLQYQTNKKEPMQVKERQLLDEEQQEEARLRRTGGQEWEGTGSLSVSEEKMDQGREWVKVPHCALFAKGVRHWRLQPFAWMWQHLLRHCHAPWRGK